MNSPSPVPLVPIVNYWSSRRSISRIEIAALFAGMGPSPTDGPAPNSTVLAVSAGDIGPLTTLLGAAPRGVDIELAAQVRSRVKGSSNVIGIIRADDVTADVRALGVDGFQLFGAEHIRNPLMWPLTADEPGVVSSFLASSEWTIAAGGDVMLDKAVFYQSIARYQGVDYAWNGGTAVIDRRFCCGWAASHWSAGAGPATRAPSATCSAARDLASSTCSRRSPTDSGITLRLHFLGRSRAPVGARGRRHRRRRVANNHIGNAGPRGVLDATATSTSWTSPTPAPGPTRRPPARRPGYRLAACASPCWLTPGRPVSYWAAPGHPGSAGY